MRAWVPFLFVLAGIALFFELGRMDIVSDHEGQRSVPPREMLASGDFIVPTINGEIYLAKPPLLYWAVAAVYAVTGTVSETTARFPTASSGFLLVLLTFFAFRRQAGDQAAGWAAIVLLTSFLFLERSRWAMIDTPFALAVFLTLIPLFAAWRTHDARRALILSVLAGIALTAANLLKGPVPYLFIWAAWIAAATLASPDAARVIRQGLVLSASVFALEVMLWAVQGVTGWERGFPLPLAIALIGWTALAMHGAGEARKRLLWTTGLAVALGTLLVLPWALLVLNATGWDYSAGLLHEQVAERTYTASEINAGDPFYFLYMLVVSCLPWGFLFFSFGSRSRWRERPAIYRTALLTSLLSVLVFSLIAGKERHYLMPALPFIALAAGFEVARFHERLQDGISSVRQKVWTVFTSVMAGFGGAGVFIYLLVNGAAGGTLAWVALFAVIGLAVTARAQWAPARQMTLLSVGLVMTCMGVLMARAEHWSGDHSFQQVASTAGDLQRAGYAVAASRMLPPMAFYAGTIIPTDLTASEISQMLDEDEPFYYVSFQEFVAALEQVSGEEGRPLQLLLGPHSHKNVVLMGNEPLPDDLDPKGAMTP